MCVAKWGSTHKAFSRGYAYSSTHFCTEYTSWHCPESQRDEPVVGQSDGVKVPTTSSVFWGPNLCVHQIVLEVVTVGLTVVETRSRNSFCDGVSSYSSGATVDVYVTRVNALPLGFEIPGLRKHFPSLDGWERGLPPRRYNPSVVRTESTIPSMIETEGLDVCLGWKRVVLLR